jgi:hypothetical protein
MHAIPNLFWVPAPATSAWDFFRLRTSRHGPASTGRWDRSNRREEADGFIAADMENEPWRV